MVLRRVLIVAVLLVLVWNCKKDDGPQVEVVPPRILSEVAAEDDVKIRAYLSTHFYNYEEFANPPAGFDFKIKIDTIAGDNAGKTPLLNQVASKVVPVAFSSFSGLQEEGNVNHTYYYLVAREGMGGKPTVGDSTLLKYEGSFLNGNLFDASSTYTWQYLPFNIRGYGDGVTNFKTGSGAVVNEDGTFGIEGSGIGMLILPSGLAYYNGVGPTGTIPRYSVMIFKIESGLYVENTDYDNDGIPSILEDLNGDGNLNNDNTDDELEPFNTYVPNHMDPDDDGDGIPTRQEIIINPDGSLVFPDSNGNGIPDYLDKDYPNKF